MDEEYARPELVNLLMIGEISNYYGTLALADSADPANGHWFGIEDYTGMCWVKVSPEFAAAVRAEFGDQTVDREMMDNCESPQDYIQEAN